ncbi:tetratricopeptide repeat protein [Breznakiella homolactica]|uniref:Tetratricopeptide repeat protein n=1 Tax=Breznakiella homolactica TaxID=2798577 RepID=A0A7T8B9G2_9SPIR|nr:hypothetical protein [Breznakiella homolactica]QQO08417.1 hypothetical protein JFL75_15980 [Breznakiella homolactica]
MKTTAWKTFCRILRSRQLAVCLLAGFFVSCQSIQKDMLVSTIEETGSSDITELERMIIPMDTGFTRQELQQARQQIQGIEKKAIRDAVFEAQLAAWSGRLYVLEGKRSDAEKQLKQSRDLYPGNIQALVLTVRLETDPEKRLALADQALALESRSGELQIERARVLLELNRYREAVASFDTAFAALNSDIYEQTYRNERNRAWELRDVAPGTGTLTADILRKETLTWRDVIDLTKNETDLLGFFTAGRDWPSDQLFSRLAERSFIPVLQDAEQTEWPSRRSPSSDETVLRSGAAWFLWHLTAENQADKQLLTKYSSRYRSIRDVRSPIPDIPVDSPYFDSVLGCIEWEIMALPDGRNFMPRETVKPSSFLQMLNKVRR